MESSGNWMWSKVEAIQSRILVVNSLCAQAKDTMKRKQWWENFYFSLRMASIVGNFEKKGKKKHAHLVVRASFLNSLWALALFVVQRMCWKKERRQKKEDTVCDHCDKIMRTNYQADHFDGLIVRWFRLIYTKMYRSIH